MSFIVYSSSRLAAIGLLVTVLMQPLWCIAEEGKAPAPKDTSPLDVLDKPHKLLSDQIVSLSTKMDSFFGDRRVFAESRKSFIRVYGDLAYAESRASDFSIKVQAKLVLPALEKRLKLLIESDDPTLNSSAETSTVTTPSGVPNVDVPKDFRAGLELLLTDSPHWYINTDAGIRIHSFLPDLFVRLRARREQDVNDWQFRLTQSVFWFEQTGAGALVQFDADRKLGANYLGRSRTIAAWSDHDQQYNFEQSFFLFQGIDENNAMSYEAGVFGASQPNSHVTAYAVGVKWRRRLHRQWLFGEVQPLLTWPEDQSFRPTTSILFRLEAVFGDVGCNCYGL